MLRFSHRIVLALFVFANSITAFANSGMIEVIPASATAGVQMSWGQCPCFRWTVVLRAAGGRIETRDLLISSDALFKMKDEAIPDLERYANRIFTVGAVDALLKGGHVGVGFQGVSFGEERDRGYSDLLRTGFYATANLLLKDAARLDIRSGYQFEAMRINQATSDSGPRVSRHQLYESAVLEWSTGAFRGGASSYIGYDIDHILNSQYFQAGAAVDVHARLVNIGDLELGMGLGISFERDGFLQLVGMQPNLYTGILSMDLAYEIGDQK